MTLKNKIRKAISPELLRYLIVGGSSFVLEISVLAFLTYVLRLEPTVAVAISFWFGLLISFVLQKIVTFKNKHKTVKKVAWQTISYGLLIVFNFGFTVLFVNIFSPLIGVLIARTIALAITICWNFLVYSKVIFK